MDTIHAYYTAAAEVLSPLYERSEAREIARRLLEDALGYSRSQLLVADKDTLLPPHCRERLSQQLQALGSGRPLQYVLGYAPFLQHSLYVAPGVLIPRPETEELVELVLEEAARAGYRSFVDIGTGSGCIAYALAAGLPELEGAYALELSEEALQVAARNFDTLRATTGRSVQLYREDLFRLVESGEGALPRGLDLIVSNPPYIHPEEAAAMSPQVLEHEPHLALFAPETSPIAYYLALARLVQQGYLCPGGSLWVELNPRYAEETLEAMRRIVGPEACTAELLRDLSGKLRFVHLHYSPQP